MFKRISFTGFIFVCVLMVWAARTHPPMRDKIEEIFHGRVFWETPTSSDPVRNNTMLRISRPNETKQTPEYVEEGSREELPEESLEEIEDEPDEEEVDDESLNISEETEEVNGEVDEPDDEDVDNDPVRNNTMLRISRPNETKQTPEPVKKGSREELTEESLNISEEENTTIALCAPIDKCRPPERNKTSLRSSNTTILRSPVDKKKVVTSVVNKSPVPDKMKRMNINCKKYPSIYSGELYEESLDILLHLEKVLSNAKIEWTIAFGSALGWKRGKSFTPYDDDMDIVMKSRDSARLRQIIKHPFCIVNFWGGLKVFKCSRPNAGRYEWKFPFVDIWDGTHVSSKWKYKDSFMFPTRPTVFAGYILSVSKNIEKHLNIKYPSVATCRTLTWDHKNERGTKNKQSSYPCSEVLKKCFSDKLDVYRYPPLDTESPKRHDILYDMLQWFDNIASKYDIKYSLVYGTLLGWRREGHIISKDTDVDVQIGSHGITKLVHLIDIGVAKAASEHGSINKNKITLLVRKTHDRLFSQVQRTSCKGKPVSYMVDGCAFNGPIARVMFKGKHIDVYFRSSYVPGAPSDWHCRKKTGCVYSQSRYSIPLPEVYPCRLGPVDTKCFGPAIVKQHLNEIYGNEWVQVGKKIYYH